MTKDDIIALPNPHLRQKSTRIHVITDEVQKLSDDMIATALDWEDSRPHEISAALAAVQVDKLERIVIVRDDFNQKSSRDFMTLINPEIVKYEGEVIADYEGRGFAKHEPATLPCFFSVLRCPGAAQPPTLPTKCRHIP